MHMKSEFFNGENFQCCFCFHVRSGTILLGIWHLVHIFAITLSLCLQIQTEPNNLTSWTTTATATPHDVNGLLTSEYYSLQLDLNAGSAADYGFGHDKGRTENAHLELAVTVCIGILTAFLLYGTIRGKPNYMMPFFCIQVLDFIISSLAAVRYFSSVPDVRKMLEDVPDLPLQKQLLHLNPEWLYAILMVAFVTCIMLKAYFIGIVWHCYKYLKLLQVAQIVGSYIEGDNEALLPPDYDTATKMPPHSALYAPPPYVADFHGV